MMDSYPSSVALECKTYICIIPNYNYLLCPPCLLPGKSSLFCDRGETALSGYRQTLKCSSLLCNCLQLFVVCSCFVRGGQNAKAMDLLWVWPLSAPALCWIERGTGPVSPPAAPPGVQWRKSAVMFVQKVEEQLCPATACQPQPVRGGVCFSGPGRARGVLGAAPCCQGWDSRDVPWSQPAGVQGPLTAQSLNTWGLQIAPEPGSRCVEARIILLKTHSWISLAYWEFTYNFFAVTFCGWSFLTFSPDCRTLHEELPGEFLPSLLSLCIFLCGSEVTP